MLSTETSTYCAQQLIELNLEKANYRGADEQLDYKVS